MNPLQRSPTAPSPEAAADLFARLQHHPHLYAQMAALLDEVENRAGAPNTGDEAEGRENLSLYPLPFALTPSRR